MRSRITLSRLSFVNCIVALLLFAAAATAQTPAAPQPTAQPPKVAPPKGASQPSWRLVVSKASPTMVTLKAKDAPLSEIAAELGKKLKTPVVLSPLMQKQRVTLDFTDVPVEGAVRMLAPLPYIDFELSGDGATQPRILGIFLYSFNEEPPARDAVTKGSEEAILITGNTEEGTEAYEKERQKDDAPLSVKFEHNLLSVHARQQPLTVVLYEIASKVDIPFEMKYESSDLVDVNFSNYTLEQAAHALSPNIRLYQRVNLTNYESTPLRLSLVQPTNSATIH
jgi:hypothetical protein